MTTSGKNSMRPDVGSAVAYGEGGVVTQLTSRTTGVTLNKRAGQITLFSAAGSATPFTFTVTNSLVDADSFVKVCQKSGTDKYSAVVTNVSDGSFDITVTDLTGTTTETPVFSFMIWQNDIT